MDKRDYSPPSRALYSGNGKILKMIQVFIQKQKNTMKTAYVHEEDLGNILCILEFPQLQDLSGEECFRSFLEPLYSDTKPFIHFLDLMGITIEIKFQVVLVEF